MRMAARDDLMDRFPGLHAVRLADMNVGPLSFVFAMGINYHIITQIF